LRFKNKLLSLDATIIDLCLSMFNWATFRQTKGAVKLHLLLDHDGYLPVYAHLTEGNVHEMVVAKSLNFPKGSVVVMNRGYIDYRQFARWTKAGIFFVTRLKENANHSDFEDWPVAKNSNVRKDQLIRLNPITAGAPCREDLRLVTVWDERNQCEVQLHHVFNLFPDLSTHIDRRTVLRSHGNTVHMNHENLLHVAQENSATAARRIGELVKRHFHPSRPETLRARRGAGLACRKASFPAQDISEEQFIEIYGGFDKRAKPRVRLILGHTSM
jgi:Transposase DDE domain